MQILALLSLALHRLSVERKEGSRWRRVAVAVLENTDRGEDHSTGTNHPRATHAGPAAIFEHLRHLAFHGSPSTSHHTLDPHLEQVDILSGQPSCYTPHPFQVFPFAWCSLWQCKFFLIPGTNSENRLPWKLLEVSTY